MLEPLDLHLSPVWLLGLSYEPGRPEFPCYLYNRYILNFKPELSRAIGPPYRQSASTTSIPGWLRRTPRTSAVLSHCFVVRHLTVVSLYVYLVRLPGKTSDEAIKVSRNPDGTLSVRCPVCQTIIHKNLPTFQAVIYKSLLHKCQIRKEPESNPQRT